ncbi:MAG: glycosyltransferase family 39 protein, partial [Chloroflexi bacterium]|nr:glycosyltransferase family 39 protein [Chloroflexota bacterium]
MKVKLANTKNSRLTPQSEASPWDASRLLASSWFISLTLFILALLPRLPDLGRFLTPDEFLWIDRSRNFLAALTDLSYQCDSVVEQWRFVAQGLACTLRTGHPGVTTMWTGSLGFLLRWLGDGRPGSLHDYVVAVSTNPLDASFIAPERLGTVLITSLAVVAFYWLARRLFGASIALLGAVLLALDPFHIALSRVIHHDALSTTFMTLSVLCAFIYWGQGSGVRGRGSGVGGQGSGVIDQRAVSGGRRSAVGGRYWLLLSGLLAGLAFLSKLSSLFLMPYIALTGLWFFVERERRTGKDFILHPRRARSARQSFILLILDGLLWFAVALTIVFILWPAMWVAPLETVQTAFLLGFKYTTGGHAKGNFLLGQVSNDPGVLFYLVTWLYRTSPLVLVGVIAGLITSLPRHPVTPSPFHRFFRYLPLILLFILGYYLLMTLGEKKQERYFLPVYPWLNLIAAAGLIAIYDFGFTISLACLRRDLRFSRNTQYAIPNTFYATA